MFHPFSLRFPRDEGGRRPRGGVLEQGREGQREMGWMVDEEGSFRGSERVLMLRFEGVLNSDWEGVRWNISSEGE